MNEYDQCPVEGQIGLLTLLISGGRAAEGRLDAALLARHLTFSKWRALDMLAHCSRPVHLGDLHVALDCAKSNVTQLVDRLEADGLVARSADPDDRRGTLVSLTEAGVAAHAAGRVAIGEAAAAFFRGFSEFDRETLMRLLTLARPRP